MYTHTQAFTAKTGLLVEDLAHPCMNNPGQSYTGKNLYPLEGSAEENARWETLPLEKYADELYAGADLLPPGRTYMVLDVTAINEDDEYFVVPTLVYALPGADIATLTGQAVGKSDKK